MATTTLENKKINNRKIAIRISDFAEIAFKNIGDSIGEMVITVLLLGGSLVYMAVHVTPYLFNLVSGYWIAGMLVQLLIRIVQRFDDSYTVNEVGLYIENDVMDRLDEISKEVKR